MEPEGDLKMKREVIEIEGGRKLYSYSFGDEDREDGADSEEGEDGHARSSRADHA